METSHEETHLIPFRVYFIVWAVLLVLTAITVGAHYADMGHVAILTAIMIASLKVSLVVLYFMHVRFESPLVIVMILAVIGTYAIFVMLTFSDYFYR
jgi:cytochrome c oxidase subunit 4